MGKDVVKTQKKVAIIGANSFIGKKLLLVNDFYEFIPVVRNSIDQDAQLIVSNYDEISETSLEGVDVAIVCVGLVKALNKDDYYKVNRDLIFSIAKNLKSIGIKHLIHFSSLSVYGWQKQISSSSVPDPKTFYGKSKLSGDEMLQTLEGPEWKITYIRPPLVYDYETGGKIASLLKIARKARFFVFPLTPVKRSIIHLNNLYQIISDVIESQQVGVVLPSDSVDIVLPDLLLKDSRSLGRKFFLIKLPKFFFQPIKFFLPSLYNSLFESSQILSPVIAKNEKHSINTFLKHYKFN